EERRPVRVLRRGRAGRHAVELHEREVDRLYAVVVAGREVEVARQAVDRQRGAPLGLAAARGVEERREPRWVELQLHERRSRVGWRAQPRIGVTERGASVLRVGLRVADGQAEPWR